MAPKAIPKTNNKVKAIPKVGNKGKCEKGEKEEVKEEVKVDNVTLMESSCKKIYKKGILHAFNVNKELPLQKHFDILINNDRIMIKMNNGRRLGCGMRGKMIKEINECIMALIGCGYMMGINDHIKHLNMLKIMAYEYKMYTLPETIKFMKELKSKKDLSNEEIDFFIEMFHKYLDKSDIVQPLKEEQTEFRENIPNPIIRFVVLMYMWGEKYKDLPRGCKTIKKIISETGIELNNRTLNVIIYNLKYFGEHHSELIEVIKLFKSKNIVPTTDNILQLHWLENQLYAEREGGERDHFINGKIRCTKYFKTMFNNVSFH